MPRATLRRSWLARLRCTHDARNRLKTLTFPDGRGNQTWTYTADNLPASIVTDNGGDQIVTNSYSYNRLRALGGERMRWGAIDWRINYNYNALSHLSSQTYPDGTNVAFDPDALGQPRQVGTFASDVAYYPNGAVASFTYGNNIKHTLTQNTRQLPARSLDDSARRSSSMTAIATTRSATWRRSVMGSRTIGVIVSWNMTR